MTFRNHINNNAILSENCANSSDTPVKPQPKPTYPVETRKNRYAVVRTGLLTCGNCCHSAKPAKNSEEFNACLKEIKAWIGSSTTEMASKIREFINKSENKNVVSVNLQKLKPATISGLYKMMKEPVKELQRPGIRCCQWETQVGFDSRVVLLQPIP